MDPDQRVFQDGEVIPGTRLRVAAMIGAGGMGQIFDVEHVELGKRFVTKVLRRECAPRSDLVARLRNEWRALGRLEHPNIVAVTDAGRTPDGIPYFVMERLEGEPLSARLRRQRRVSIPLALHVASSVLKGLAAAHEIGIVHRDVKPSNVFLTKGGGVKLLDFGVAKSEDPKAAITATGIAVGTPRYMSPEQVNGARVDGRTDLYATGLLLYEMMAGQVPFEQARDTTELFTLLTSRDAPRLSSALPGISAELEALVAGLLARDPRVRPSSCRQVEETLRRVAAKARQGISPDAPTRSIENGLSSPPLPPGLVEQEPPARSGASWRPPPPKHTLRSAGAVSHRPPPVARTEEVAEPAQPQPQSHLCRGDDTTTNDLLAGSPASSGPQRISRPPAVETPPGIPNSGPDPAAQRASDAPSPANEIGALDAADSEGPPITHTEVRAPNWEVAGADAEPGQAIVPQDWTHPDQRAWHDGDDDVAESDFPSPDNTLRLYEPEGPMAPRYDECATETHTAVPVSDSGLSETPPPVEPGRYAQDGRSGPGGQVRIRALGVGLLAFTLAASAAWLALRVRASLEHPALAPAAGGDPLAASIAASSARAAPQPQVTAPKDPPAQLSTSPSAQPQERETIGATAAGRSAGSARPNERVRAGGRGGKRAGRARTATRTARVARAVPAPAVAKQRAEAPSASGHASAKAAVATANAWRLGANAEQRKSQASPVAPRPNNRRLKLPGSGL